MIDTTNTLNDLSFEGFFKEVFRREPTTITGEDGNQVYCGDADTAHRVWWKLKNATPSEISEDAAHMESMEETELPRRKLLEMCDNAQKIALERGDKLFKANQRIHDLEQELCQKREISGEWRRFSSAPKDGTSIIVCYEILNGQTAGYRGVSSSSFTHGRWNGFPEHSYSLVGWQPFPEFMTTDDIEDVSQS